MPLGLWAPDQPGGRSWVARLRRLRRRSRGSICGVGDARATGHPAWKSSAASCSRYFMDLDRLVGLSTRVPPGSGQPAQITTDFQSRLAELTGSKPRSR
jgi:hypothetical protein